MMQVAGERRGIGIARYGENLGAGGGREKLREYLPLFAHGAIAIHPNSLRPTARETVQREQPRERDGTGKTGRYARVREVAPAARVVVNRRYKTACDVIGMVLGRAARVAPQIRRALWLREWKVAGAGSSACERPKPRG